MEYQQFVKRFVAINMSMIIVIIAISYILLGIYKRIIVMTKSYRIIKTYFTAAH